MKIQRDERFGKLLVISAWGGQAKCICDCGKVVTIPSHRILRGQTSCGCVDRKKQHRKQLRQAAWDKIHVGDKFGHLTIVERNHRELVCKCDCGNTVATKLGRFRRGLIQSCGCLKQPAMKAGDRFGYLTVLSVENQMALCQCECGQETSVRCDHLRSSQTKSCGCFRKRMNKRPVTIRALQWQLIQGSSMTLVTPEWHDYRGLRAWAEGQGFKPGMTIVRLDPKGPFEYANCKVVWPEKEKPSKRIPLT